MIMIIRVYSLKLLKLFSILLALPLILSLSVQAHAESCPADILNAPPIFNSATPAARLECVTGDTYFFTLAGYKPGEIINPVTVQTVDPTNTLMSTLISATAQVNDKGNAVVKVTFDQPNRRGKWTLKVLGSQNSQASTTFEFKPVKKFLVSAKQMKDPKTGQILFLLISSGWQSKESLSIGTQAPGGKPSVNPLGMADEYGFYGPIKLPFVANPADGLYQVWIKGQAEQATLAILCKAGTCSP